MIRIKLQVTSVKSSLKGDNFTIKFMTTDAQD